MAGNYGGTQRYCGTNVKLEYPELAVVNCPLETHRSESGRQFGVNALNFALQLWRKRLRCYKPLHESFARSGKPFNSQRPVDLSCGSAGKLGRDTFLH